MTLTSLLGLPIDIVVDEILLRLPITSLITLKCVNKFFLSLISSQKFIHLHSLRQSNINRFLILESKDHGFDSHRYCIELNAPIARVMKLPLKVNYFNRSLQLVGSCNGLMCLVRYRVRLFANDTEQLLFANPCTGMYKFSAVLRLSTPISSNCCVAEPTSFGFGYHSIIDDYKVVGYNRQYVSAGGKVVSHVVQVVVYSTKADAWRRIDNAGTCSEDYVNKNSVVVLVNKHLLHWHFLRDTKDRVSRIGCFNLVTEKWMADVPLPQIAGFFELHAINDNLCLKMDDYHKTRQFSIWIMKEYGVEESWVKLVVDFPEGIVHCLPDMDFAYRTETGEEIFLVNAISNADTYGRRMSCWYWYNMNRQTYDRLEGMSPEQFRFLATSTLSFVSIV